MKTPLQFFRTYRRNKVKRLAAEVLRMSNSGGQIGPRNPEVKNITIPVYRKMLRDSEVASDLTLKELLMVPTLRVMEPDGDEKSKKATQFIKAIEQAMPGSPISVYRNQALHEALISGMLIGEPVFKKMDIPGFGVVKGLSGITIANSEDFSGNTEMDEYGKIEHFIQNRSGSVELSPDEVLYYGYKTISGNPEGISALFAAHDPWKLKLIAFRNLSTFMNTNASGFSIMGIPPDYFIDEREDALQFLRNLAETGNIAKPTDWELDFENPPGDAGKHFISIIQEICNKSIRKAILYDETITAESLHSWRSGTDETNQNLVIEMMKAEGEEFAESFIQEQLYRRILDVNGMRDYPTPLAVTGLAMQKKEPVAILSALGKAKSDGILDKVALPAETQAQIMAEMVDSIGTPCDASQIEVISQGIETSDGLSSGDYARASAVISDLWDKTLPGIVNGLNNSLPVAYDDENYGIMRELVEKAITTGGGDFRKALTGLSANRDAGAASNSAYLRLKRGYSRLSERIFAELNDSIQKKLDSKQAFTNVEACLEDQKAEFISIVLERL